MDLGGLRAAIMDSDSDQRVFRVSLGIFDKDVEVAILIENACVEKFVLHLFARAPPVGLYQIAIGKLTPAGTCTGTSCRSA